jgi:hypothetical protein
MTQMPQYLQVAAKRQTRWWHDHIIDDMLLHPFDTLVQRGQRLGYTPNWLHILLKSDMFQAAYQARKGELNDQIRDSMAVKLGKVADKHLEVLLEQLETKRTNIPFADLAASTNNVLEKLGFGTPKAGPQTVVNVQQNAAGGQVVSAELLAEAREKLRANEAVLGLAPKAPQNLDYLVGEAPEPAGRDDDA